LSLGLGLLLLLHHLLLSGRRHVLEVLLHHTLVHSLVGVLLATTSSTLEVTVATLVTTHVLSGQELEHILEKRHKVRSGGDFVKEVGATVVSSVLLEVCLILGFFERDLTEFLNLVVVNVKRSFAENLVVETSLCHGSLIGSLEANESVNILTLIVREHLKAFNVTELFEALLKVLFSGLGREVLDVQVASLLGVFVLEHLTGSLDGSALFLKGFLNVELVTIDFLVVETLDSGSSSLRSVFSVLLVFGVIANESVSTLVVAAELAALNTAVSREKFTQFLLSEVLRQVLHVNVVENAAEVTLVLRLVLDTDISVLVDSVIKSFLGAFRGLETDETVATRGVITIKRDLKTLDITILGEVFLKLLGVHVSGDLLDEEVVINESLGVGSE